MAKRKNGRWKRALPLSAIMLATLSSEAGELQRLPPVPLQADRNQPVHRVDIANSVPGATKADSLVWFQSAAIPRNRFEFDFLRMANWSHFYSNPPVIVSADSNRNDFVDEAPTSEADASDYRYVSRPAVHSDASDYYYVSQPASNTEQSVTVPPIPPSDAPMAVPAPIPSPDVGSSLPETDPSGGYSNGASTIICDDSFVTTYQGPCWYMQVDPMVLNRSPNRNIKIVEMGTGTPPRGQRAALLTTDDLDYDPAWGFRATIGRQISDIRRFEITYLGFHHWVATGHFDGINGPGFAFNNIDVPFDANITSDFDGGQLVRATYASELHSVEANLLTDTRWDLNRSAGYPWYYYVDFLGGFRYIRLDEEFDLESTDAGETSNYLIDATNDMLGGQLGFLAGTYLTSTWSWNLTGKIGVLANMAEQSTLMRDDENTVLLRDFKTKGQELAFFTELNVGLAYDLNQYWSITGGYFLLWIDGVALAPEQIDYSTTPTSGSRLNQNGDIFLHGGFVGLRYAY